MGLKHPIFARLYDFYMLPQELWGVRVRRRCVLADAAGTVLELGVGTGLNLPLYRRVRVVVGIEPDPHMIRRACRRAGEAHVPIRLVLARGEALPFPDGSFDTVIATLVFATIPDATAAARELWRVLRSDGTFLFFEHFRSENRLLAGLQDAVTPLWRRLLGGCEPNRDIIRIFAETGFQVLETTKFRGTFLLHGIARPVLASRRDSQMTGKGERSLCGLS
ncbi:MAG: class I SAM-dependent methyltransferase [Candidatus Binatia bacterium]